MKVSDMIERTVFIITEYYHNNLEPWLEALDEQVLWYGPAFGQFMEGRDTLIRAWDSENNPLTFSMCNTRARGIRMGAAACEVMVTYTVTTHYPSGKHIPVYQRLHFSWVERREKGADGTFAPVPKIAMAHITNPYHQHETDTIYPVHFDEIYQTTTQSIISGRKMTFHGPENTLYALLSDSIIWIETIKSSRRCLIHAVDGTCEVTEPISEIERKYNDLFLRIHISYLVNPSFVKKLVRFYAVMNDGKKLPIPEKRYTQVKQRLYDMI